MSMYMCPTCKETFCEDTCIYEWIECEPICPICKDYLVLLREY